jgi:KDO2-lipid IV(A) lauroyltransferase
VILMFRALYATSRVVPLRWLLPLGSGVGNLGYVISKRYRGVALKNLKIAYGDELSEADRRRIARAVFRNFGKAVIEFPYIASKSPDQIRKIALLEEADRERVDQGLAEGRGLLLISAHFGNFELMIRRLVIEGYSTSVVARNDDNTAFAKVVNGIREGAGYNVFGRGNAARPIIRHLRNGGLLGMLPDQKSEDTFVPFFGQLSGTVAGPAVLSLRTGAPLLPAFCIRQPDDTHKIIVLDAFHTKYTGDVDADTERIMTEVNRIIESFIRQYPDQWLWLHDRWKVVPPPEVAAAWEAKGQAPSSAC